MTATRIGIAHPSSSAIEVLRKAVESLPDHAVAWSARDADDALRRAASEPVSVVLLSMDLPGPAAAATVRRLESQCHAAVLLVRTGRGERVNEVYDAMEVGALDVVDMPWLDGSSVLHGLSSLVRKLALAARLGARRAADRSLREATPAAPAAAPAHNPSSYPPSTRSGSVLTATRGHAPAMVAIGASTGGPNAVSRVLASLPRPFPAAIVIVQHVDESFAGTIAAWVAQSSGFPVSLAKSGDGLRVGEALLAATSDHLCVASDGRLDYIAEPRDYPYRPSVDVFFESVAAHHRGTAVGVLLTGMGRDGAKGLMAMRQAGHRTIAQDEGSSVIYGMPRAAAEAGAADEVLDIDRIGHAIERSIRGRRTALPG